MSDTLYISLEQKIKVTAPEVSIGQLGKIWCSSSSRLARCRALRFTVMKEKRMVFSIVDVTEAIQKCCPEVEIENLGETDFILELEQVKKTCVVWEVLKACFVCMIIFFGAAFSIMTFNADVNVEQVFRDVHMLLTGEEREGISMLEAGYSAGLFLGIILFFDRFRRRTGTSDPTPLEIEMKTYEKDMNQTIVEQSLREKKKNRY